MIIYVLSLPLLSEQFCNKFGLWIWGVHHHGLWPRGVCVQQEGALFSGDLRHKPGGWALGTSLLHVQPMINTQILRICMQKSTCTNILNSEVLHIVNSIHKKISLSKWSKIFASWWRHYSILLFPQYMYVAVHNIYESIYWYLYILYEEYIIMIWCSCQFFILSALHWHSPQ